jgi:hypothetical protein
MPGGHYEPFLSGHERTVEAELTFLRRHLLEPPGAGRSGSRIAELAPQTGGRV